MLAAKPSAQPAHMSHIDLLPQLPPAIARHTLFLLLESLPPPLSDTPEERAARDEAAIASVAALNPGDAFEARLAARAVATDARATEALLRSLRAMQAAREKAEAAAQPAPVPAEPHARDVAAEADEFARRRPKD